MAQHITGEDAQRHDSLTTQGWAMIKDLMLLHGQPSRRIGFFAKRKLRKASKRFQAALQIVPDSYSSKWALGKIHQALGNHPEALVWFEGAWELNNENADVGREASLEAMDCGEFEKALAFGDGAIALEPDSAGLHCNRALVLMFLGRDAEAAKSVSASLALDSSDKITLKVRDLLEAVASGRRKRPQAAADL